MSKVLHFLGREQVPKAARLVPPDVFVVVDEEGRPYMAATDSQSCHERISGVIENGHVEAREWVVRRYVLAREHT